MPVLHPDHETQLETICKRGCRYVNQAIDRLERGLPVAETRGLDPGQRGRLLAELKSIMAVYAEKGGTCE